LSWRELTATVREDWVAHGRCPIASPGFLTLCVYRFGRWSRTLPAPLRLGPRVLHLVVSILLRNTTGIELPLEAEIGRRVVFAHQGGTVIAKDARIGDDTIVRHNVTIGADAAGSTRGGPVVGNSVQIGAGAVLIGPVVVGDGARIGPNAVVMKDVPAGASAFAMPARIMPAMQPVEADG
jgi:serine O-acetyltransferase